MALTVTNLNTAARTTTSSTLEVPGITAGVGDWLYIAVAADNSDTGGGPSLLPTLTDSSGNSYTNRVLATRDPGDVNQGTTLGLWASRVAVAVADGVLTVEFSPDTPVTAAVVQRVQKSSDAEILVRSVGTALSGAASGATALMSIGTVLAGDAVFVAIAAETSLAITGDTDTLGGPWSAVYQRAGNAGSTSLSQAVATQYKVPDTAASQEVRFSLASLSDYVESWLSLYETTAAVAAPGVQAQAFVGEVLVGIVETLTGVQAEGHVGLLEVQTSAQLIGVGVQAEAQTGVVAVGFVVSPAGVQGQLGLGTVAVRTAAALALLGVSAQTQLGTIAVTAAAQAPATGVRVLAYVGEVQVTVSNTRVLVAGVYALGAVGPAFVWGLVNDTQPADWHNINDSQDPGWAPVLDAQTPGWAPVP